MLPVQKRGLRFSAAGPLFPFRVCDQAFMEIPQNQELGSAELAIKAATWEVSIKAMANVILL